MTASVLANSSARGAPLRVLVADTRDLGIEYVDTVVSDDDHRAAAQMSPSRRTQYLAGRALLRRAVEQSTQRPAKAQRFTARAGGKPDCLDGPPISVSHSGPLVVCAVAPAGEVGIDVQFPARHHHTEEIAREWFTPAECAWLRRAPRDAFYRLWVLKEAYLKCTGYGLAGGLASLECCVEPPVIEVRAPRGVRLALYSAGSALVGIAASTADSAEICIEAWPALPTRARTMPIHFIAATTSA